MTEGGPLIERPLLERVFKGDIALTVLLLLAMAMSTFTAHALGILASFLIDEFSITRAELGTIIAVSSALGAVVAIPAGRGVDLIGAKNALLALFATSALAFFLYALANNIAMMLVASAIASIPLASANSATNKTIALHLPSSIRGTVTGVKQSGVVAGLWIGGILLPPAALSLGWRAAMAIIGSVTVVSLVAIGALLMGFTASSWNSVGMLAVITRSGLERAGRESGVLMFGFMLGLGIGPPTAVLVPRERSETGRQSVETRSLRLNADLIALTVFAFLFGFANSAMAFMPLYAHEVLGLSPVMSGASVALVGIAGVVGRVVWARRADRHRQFEKILQWQAVGGTIAYGIVLTAPYGAGAWQLAIGALLMGFTASSWNSVGMLAVITRSGLERAGRESGVLMFGFMLGLGIGPPIQGWSVDLTGSYNILWSMSLIMALIGFAVMASRRRSLP